MKLRLFVGISTLLFLVLLCTPGPAGAVSTGREAFDLFSSAPAAGSDEVPARVPGGFLRVDTLSFGYYTEIAGQSYAVLGETWTFDHGAPDAFEGWYAQDLTENSRDFFQRITAASWSGHGNPVAAPIIAGNASVWCGIHKDQTDSLCWLGGLGYGNNWCQRFESPQFQWTGDGNVILQFLYFNNSEPSFDYTQVLLVAGGEPVPLNGAGFTGVAGAPPAGPWASWVRSITPQDFGSPGPQPFRLRFEFTSDGGWSDEDGLYPTTYGPFGLDQLAVTGAVQEQGSFGFENGLEGWTASRCPGIGSYFSIQPLSQYVILDPCMCNLAGNVAAFHDSQYEHPVGQMVRAVSPIVDRTSYQSYNKIFADWDQYSELPQNNGVFYRPQFTYYPYICPSSGAVIWSPFVSPQTWTYTGDVPICHHQTSVGTDSGVPADCQLVRFAYEVFSSCDAFGIPPTLCTGITNFTPVIDNLRVRMVHVPDAPVANFDTGGRYQDGFGQTMGNQVGSLGNANTWLATNAGAPGGTWRLGDSLVVVGPTVTPSTRWEAKLWLRIRREGPFQVHNASYRAWKEKVRDGRQIVGPTGAFTWAWMDSVELGTQVAKNKFDSYFRENDDDYTPGTPPKPDIGNQNAIIPDGILVPGTKIEYFVTSNYTCMPGEVYVFPDTTGGNYAEFEILPSFRTDFQTGYWKMPCILYVNASDNREHTWIDGALNILLNGHTPEGAMSDIPDPTTWDRYDYQGAASCCGAPMIRGSGASNNGATVEELTAYRTILFNTGFWGEGTTHEEDWVGLDQWLTGWNCGGGPSGLWASGDQIAQIIDYRDPGFLGSRLGASLVCSPYDSPSCPPGDPDNDENDCVGLETVGAAWTPELPLDLWGNWCPSMRPFSVLGTTGAGVGQKSYRKQTPNHARTDFAQVVNSVEGFDGYRTVLDGYSAERIITPLGSDPATECAFDTLRILQGMTAEMGPMLRWLMNLAPGYDLTQLGLCIDNCEEWLGAPDPASPETGPVNRLDSVFPNPIASGASLRFSLARTGPVTLSVFDATGRRLRVLVDGPLPAGKHLASWDGRDDSGRRVSAGVYWVRMSTEGFTSKMKMVVVR